VLAIGWLLGGTVGVGTVLFAVSIGPLVQFFLPLLDTAAPASPSAKLGVSNELRTVLAPAARDQGA
jgi:uncharacterized membrane protein YczE